MPCLCLWRRTVGNKSDVQIFGRSAAPAKISGDVPLIWDIFTSFSKTSPVFGFLGFGHIGRLIIRNWGCCRGERAAGR